MMLQIVVSWSQNAMSIPVRLSSLHQPLSHSNMLLTACSRSISRFIISMSALGLILSFGFVAADRPAIFLLDRPLLSSPPTSLASCSLAETI